MTNTNANSGTPLASDRRLIVRDLGKTYVIGSDAHEVFRDVELTVEPGEIVCIVGPSGVGKTTLLRCLAALSEPTTGTVMLHGQKLVRPVPELSVVFQDYSRSLLPWMRAGANVAFPLESKGVKKAERSARAIDALQKVGLAGAEKKYPWQMSGGMQQRVAIARALAYQAELLLMDEPFASVDAQTRFDLEDLVLRLRDEFGLSIVLVTHDIDEAVYLADRVIVLAGRPASVADVIDVKLGSQRDQIDTKALPEFTEARSRVLGRIRRN